jgi:hypothetical protein|uniref:Uncharacterized protein n=1 Tax=Picea glauca TaxID=3330 RepID=A0A101M395_PICGL|nr:hypothetical protein ABT39_MTgene58 [Picea glauca]
MDIYIDGWLEDLACSLDVSVCMGGGKAGCTGQSRVHRMISYGRDGRFISFVLLIGWGLDKPLPISLELNLREGIEPFWEGLEPVFRNGGD